MGRLFTYGDEEGQALPLAKRFPPHLQSPDDLDAQPLFLRLPIYPDACHMLRVELEASMTMEVGSDASATLEVPGEAWVVVDYGDVPDVVLEVGTDATVTLDVEDCDQ